MTAIAPDRIETDQPRLLVGARRRHPMAEATPDAFDRQWEAFLKHEPIAFAVDGVRYGAYCKVDAESIEYICAVEVADFDDAPADWGRMRLPEARYAVFRHDRLIAEISATWSAVMGGWRAKMAQDKPAFERYSAEFHPEKPGGVEIWIPVE